MISVANEIAEAGFDPQGRTSEDLLDLAESRVFKIAESRANKDEGPKNIADVLDATVARIEQLFQQPHDGVTGSKHRLLTISTKKPLACSRRI
ncbi:replicative DNA helicase [Escherichia coli]|uniref:Replicative DNA helicase n=1 Tax=Escherichia coli TaxID=562 RepID=A0A376L4D5_ECOLX|nr:replicative DNA helicase [Escherichia coli]